jgi:hypothetical protein
MRFVATSAVSAGNITNTDLLDLKCVATSATAASRILQAVKLKSVDMWCTSVSDTATNSIECQMLTTNPYFGSMSKVFSDSAMGVSDIAHVHAVPPVGSFSGDWVPNIAGTSYPLFQLTCPDGCIVDIVVLVQFKEEETATSVTGTVAAATAGILYTRALNSSTNVNSLVPIGCITI